MHIERPPIISPALHPQHPDGRHANEPAGMNRIR